MTQDLASLLETLSGQPPRHYSTFDFGESKDEQCLSVVVPENEAEALVYELRKNLPSGFVAFAGTTQSLGDESEDGTTEVVLGKGESQFDILRLARTVDSNFDRGTDDLMQKLQSWHHSFGIDIVLAESDAIQFNLDRLPDDLRAFANEVYKFCPDIVDQGDDSVDELEQSIKENQAVFLWWD